MQDVRGLEPHIVAQDGSVLEYFMTGAMAVQRCNLVQISMGVTGAMSFPHVSQPTQGGLSSGSLCIPSWLGTIISSSGPDRCLDQGRLGYMAHTWLYHQRGGYVYLPW
jgi:hypothetical protein